MQAYISHLVENYFEPMRAKLKLPNHQKFVLILDVYSAHRDAGLMEWVKATHAMLILLFVPASFTPFLQPLDVACNNVFKGKLF